MDDLDTFITLRADWKAQGCPSDHAYLRMELPAPAPIEPLVAGITSAMVAEAAVLCADLPERPYWA